MLCGSAVQANASSASADDRHPKHLVVLANGILSNPDDWKHFRGQLLKEPEHNLLLYADEDNVHCNTLKGIDVAGKRLAEGILEVVKQTPSLRKISFVAHSLGGLFVRYCLALLYRAGGEESAKSADERSVLRGLGEAKSGELSSEQNTGCTKTLEQPASVECADEGSACCRGEETSANSTAEKSSVFKSRLLAEGCLSTELRSTGRGTRLGEEGSACGTVEGQPMDLQTPEAEACCNKMIRMERDAHQEQQCSATRHKGTEHQMCAEHQKPPEHRESTGRQEGVHRRKSTALHSSSPKALVFRTVHASAGRIGANLDPPDQELISNLAADHKSSSATIAGLIPAHLIFIASPHLGVWGRRQWPFARGVHSFERIASCFSGMFLGRTLGQLFLRDRGASGEPLLLSMSKDCEGRPFVSALGAFQTRHMYANVKYDKALGWKTSCIRSDDELVRVRKVCWERAERQEWISDRYQYIVHVEDTPARESCTLHASGLSTYVFAPPLTRHLLEAVRTTSRKKDKRVAIGAEKGRAHKWSSKDACRALAARMISGLHQVSWRKVDVLYHSAPAKWYAHQMLIMKDARKQAAGQGVVNHMLDVLCDRI